MRCHNSQIRPRKKQIKNPLHMGFFGFVLNNLLLDDFYIMQEKWMNERNPT